MVVYASSCVSQISFCFQTSRREKQQCQKFFKKLIISLSSLDSYLHSGTAREFFGSWSNAAHSGTWVVADRWAQQATHLEGPKGKALAVYPDKYAHLLLSASFIDKLSTHQLSGRSKRFLIPPGTQCWPSFV